MPSQFNFDVILSMCNLTNTRGRRIAAKVICQNERLKRELNSVSGGQESSSVSSGAAKEGAESKMVVGEGGCKEEGGTRIQLPGQATALTAVL